MKKIKPSLKMRVTSLDLPVARVAPQINLYAVRLSTRKSKVME